MKHPDKQIQIKQSDFLSRCSPSEKDYHATIFRIGNAACTYHLLASDTSQNTLELYYSEWIESLPKNISDTMQGFEECKTMLPFLRYVNERNNIGMDEWMKEHLSGDDYKIYLDDQYPTPDDNNRTS